MNVIDGMTTIAEFAKSAGTSPTNVKNWMDRAGKGPQNVVSGVKFFLVSDLKEAMENFSRSAGVFQKLGYVSAEAFDIIAEQHAKLSVELADALRQIDALRGEVSFVVESFDSLQLDYATLLAQKDELEEELEAGKQDIKGLKAALGAKVFDAPEGK